MTTTRTGWWVLGEDGVLEKHASAACSALGDAARPVAFDRDRQPAGRWCTPCMALLIQPPRDVLALLAA